MSTQLIALLSPQKLKQTQTVLVRTLVLVLATMAVVATATVLDLKPEQRVYLSVRNKSPDVFLETVCEKQMVCKSYVDAVSRCSESTRLGQCVRMRMGGDFNRDGCGSSGDVVSLPSSVMPSPLQCKTRAFSGVIAALGDRGEVTQ